MLGEVKHTKGPWTVEYDEMIEGHVIRMASAIESPGNFEVQHSVEYTHGLFPDENDEVGRQQFEEAEANANLMGSSPDLLKACKHAAIFLDGKGYRDTEAQEREDLRSEILRAIAKAEGRP